MNSGFFLCVDKPVGLTSHDVVAMMRFFLQTKKIGHTGTLDPFATGVLILAIGSATRLIQYLPDGPKTYHAKLRLGIETETADCEGKVVKEATIPAFSQEELDAKLSGFIGIIEQEPPLYSAIRVDGKRLYEYARAGQPVEIPKRMVNIHSFSAQKVEEDIISCQVTCSKGTYIRSLGVDLAVSLGTVGYLEQLRRFSSDGILADKAMTFEELSLIVAGTEDWKLALQRGGEEHFPRVKTDVVVEKVMARCVPIEEAFATFPTWYVDDADIAQKTQYGVSPECDFDIADGEKFAIKYKAKIFAIAEKRGPIAKLLRVITQPPINQETNHRENDDGARQTSIFDK